MTETEKMLAGKIYNCMDEDIQLHQAEMEKWLHEFNQAEPRSEKRKALLKKLMPKASEDISIRGNLYLDHGRFITIGDGFYANFNLTLLDVCPISIGKNVFCGTGVSIITPLHPLVAEERRAYTHPDGSYHDDEYGAPVTIGDDVWLCSNVTVLPGVTIGEGAVIGAGSVVTHDIPANVLAAGNPCRVIRPIEEKDRLKYHPELFE